MEVNLDNLPGPIDYAHSVHSPSPTTLSPQISNYSHHSNDLPFKPSSTDNDEAWDDETQATAIISDFTNGTFASSHENVSSSIQTSSHSVTGPPPSLMADPPIPPHTEQSAPMKLIQDHISAIGAYNNTFTARLARMEAIAVNLSEEKLSGIISQSIQGTFDAKTIELEENINQKTSEMTDTIQEQTSIAKTEIDNHISIMRNVQDEMTTTKNELTTTKNDFKTQTNLLLKGERVDNIIKSKVDIVMSEHKKNSLMAESRNLACWTTEHLPLKSKNSSKRPKATTSSLPRTSPSSKKTSIIFAKSENQSLLKRTLKFT